MIRKAIEDMILPLRKKGQTTEVNFLKTIITEFDLESSRDAKKFSELSVVKKMRDNAIACKNDEEVTFLEQFLPKLMDDGEIYLALAALEVSAQNIGAYMKAWNTNPELRGKADMKRVSQLVKETYLD